MKQSLLHRTVIAATSLISACWAGDSRIPDGGASTGGLVIEALQRSARNFSANYGFTHTDYVEFRVLHRGRAIAVAGEAGKPLSEVRDAWVLADAPRPAVLMGNTGWNLVTEEADGHVRLTPLTPHGGDGSVQWLDTPTGLGPLHRSQLRSDAKDPRVLRGGRRLLIGGSVVLDVDTLQWRRLELRVPQGYQDTGLEPVLWPAAGGALVTLYRGASNSPHDSLLVVSEPASGASHILGFDLGSTGRREFQRPDAAWLDRHFELATQPDGPPPRLRQRRVASDAPWQLRYQLGAAVPAGPQASLQRLSLAPVRPSMLQAAHALAATTLQTQDLPPLAGDPPAAGFVRVKMWLAPLVLRFDPATQALIVESDGAQGLLQAQAAVREVGTLLEQQLGEGKLGQHLLRDKRP